MIADTALWETKGSTVRRRRPVSTYEQLAVGRRADIPYTLSAQAKLVLTPHEVYLPEPKLAVEGSGGVQAGFDFRGAKNDVAGRMLTVHPSPYCSLFGCS
jgi:hypothetical protein